MKPYTQTLVVQTNEDFKQVIAYAKEAAIKDFSLMCVEHLEEGKPESEAFTSLLTKVVESTISRHFLRDIALTKGPEEALKLVESQPALEVWTDEGAFVDKRRVVFYVAQGENNALCVKLNSRRLKISLLKVKSSRQLFKRHISSLKSNFRNWTKHE
jgi:chromosome segregation ATPase